MELAEQPGREVLRGREPRPWLVVSVTARGGVLRDLAGGTVEVSCRALAPDPVVGEEVRT